MTGVTSLGSDSDLRRGLWRAEPRGPWLVRPMTGHVIWRLGSWATDTSDKYEREVGGGWRVGDDCADVLLNKDVADGTRVASPPPSKHDRLRDE